METQPNPVRWLIAANVVWLLMGVLAYFTAATLVLGTAVALVVALPGVLELRRRFLGTRLDQTLAALIGTWTVMAVLVLIPYIASEQGLSLWSSAGFQGVGLAAASLGFLLWNLAVAGVLGRPLRSLRPALLFHLLAVGVALYLLPEDGTARQIVLRGQAYAFVDLQASPLAAALPGMLWAASLPRHVPPAPEAEATGDLARDTGSGTAPQEPERANEPSR